MTEPEIALVRDSFRKLGPIADQAAALFYARLFEIDPSLRHLFHGEMEAQGRRLMQMLATVVDSLDDQPVMVQSLRQLGARHTGYAVRQEHYTSVGAALLWMLEKGLDGEFTPAVRAAWTKTYALLSDTMIAGARSAAAAA